MLESIHHRSPTAELLLNTVKLVDREVEVTWVDEHAAGHFSPLWLRDHCHSKESLHPETLQRQVDTFAIPVDEVIDVMGEIGREMDVRYRETAGGGLAATPTGRRQGSSAPAPRS